MDDRAKAVIVVAVAAVMGIGGVLAVEAVTGFQPGATPAASIARVEVPGRPLRCRHRAYRRARCRHPSRPPSRTRRRPLPHGRRRGRNLVVWTRNLRRVRCRDRWEEPIPRGHLVWPALLGHQRRRSVDDHLAGGPEGSRTSIAFDGDQAYVASWRELPYDPDTCGGKDAFAPSAGVYYRWRTLPEGAWSKRSRSASAATTSPPSGSTPACSTRSSGTRPRDHLLHPVDTGPGGQRPAQDRRRRRRVAAGRRRWTGARRLLGRRFAPLRDLRRVRLLDLEDLEVARPMVRPCSSSGPGNQPHVVYTIVRPTEGCGDVGSDSRAGTYYATMANGKWTSKRITKHLGLSSLALDPEPAVSMSSKATRCTRRSRPGAGSRQRCPREVDLPVMRLDPATGSLLVVYLRSNADGESDGLFAITTR